jgi:hypothetical protein
MLKFVSKDVSPIGGYWFVDPDNKHNYGRHASFEELERRVTAFRSQNNLPRIEKFRVVWEAFVCANTPEMRSRCCRVSADIKRKFSQYWSGAKAYVKAMSGGVDAFVPQEEAEMRAYVCSICTNNLRNIGHSHAQFYTDKFMRAQVGVRKTTLDDKLLTCRECTCLNRAKVHYSSEIVAESLTPQEASRMRRSPRNIKTGGPLRCWQLDCVEQVNNKKGK